MLVLGCFPSDLGVTLAAAFTAARGIKLAIPVGWEGDDLPREMMDIVEKLAKGAEDQAAQGVTMLKEFLGTA